MVPALRLADHGISPGAASVTEEKPKLPQRIPGATVPRGERRTPVPNVSDDRWYLDEKSMMILLNGLRRWQVIDR
ncbi:hypothetical protein KRMM14A1259_13640 [Krasilnikovia sp. MM14-A1259]